MPSRRLAAVLDLLLDAPDASRVLVLKAARRTRSLASRADRWLQHRFSPPAPAPAGPGPVPVDRPAGSRATAAPQRFLLVRIIGNDLYPRHDAGQSLQNLRFILEHEPTLPGCEKRWLLNRIRQPERLRELTGLLDAYGYGYDVIPYDPEAFAAVPWDWRVLPAPDFLASPAFRRLLSHQRLGWELALYRHKNNYLMHNNGARNRALELGRDRADWILPWDGNCFLTSAGWQALCRAVEAHPQAAYFHVPMQRIADNADLLDPGFEPDPCDEPQLLFSARAAERFNPAFPYGRRPKVELFWRLGLQGSWDQWPDEPWDQPRRLRLNPAPVCPQAGWVARLHSGVRGAAAAAGSAVLSQQGRYSARNLAIKASINQALLPGDGVLCPSAFSAHWCQPSTGDADPLVERAGSLLERWWGWWQQGGAPPEASAEQLISAFCQLHRHALGASAHGWQVSLLERLAAVWFAEGGTGLQPRLRLLDRPLARGRLARTAPSIRVALQLALLSDLLVWSRTPDQDGASRSPAPAWSAPVLTWCGAFTDHLQALVDPAWLRERSAHQQRLQLTLALLQRHRGHPTAAADALLRLLAFHHPDGETSRQAPADPELRQLTLALAAQHGLLDSGLAVALGWDPAALHHPHPIPPLVPLPVA